MDVQLSPFLTKQLYKNYLYSFSSESKSSAQTHLGGYAQKILILVAVKDYPFISDNDLDFLGKILLPCCLAMNDVALVNTFSSTMETGSLLSHFTPEKVVMFGVNQDSLALPLRFPDYQVQPFNNCTYLAAPALADLQKDAAGKKELWASLQKLFSLK